MSNAFSIENESNKKYKIHYFHENILINPMNLSNNKFFNIEGQIKNNQDCDYFIIFKVNKNKDWIIEVNERVTNENEIIKISNNSSSKIKFYTNKRNKVNLYIIKSDINEEIDLNSFILINYSSQYLNLKKNFNFSEYLKLLLSNDKSFLDEKQSKLNLLINNEKVNTFILEHKNENFMTKKDGIYSKEFHELLQSELSNFEDIKRQKEKHLVDLELLENNLLTSLNSTNDVIEEDIDLKNNVEIRYKDDYYHRYTKKEKMFIIIKDSFLNMLKEILNIFLISLNVKEWSFLSLILLAYFIGISIKLIL